MSQITRDYGDLYGRTKHPHGNRMPLTMNMCDKWRGWTEERGDEILSEKEIDGKGVGLERKSRKRQKDDLTKACSLTRTVYVRLAH